MSGEATTFLAAFTRDPVADFFVRDAAVRLGLEPWTNPYAGPTTQLCSLEGGQLSCAFTAPTVDADTTVWFRFDARVPATWGTVGTNALAAIAFLPSPTLGDTLFSRRIKLPEGWVSITFDRTR